MNKEETYYNIKKLIKEYNKRIEVCSRQWDELNENVNMSSDDYAIIGENMKSLVNEMQIYEDFILELNELIEG